MRSIPVFVHLPMYACILGIVAALTPFDDATAVFYHSWVRQSHVVSEASTFLNYNYTIYNDSYENEYLGTSDRMPIIVDWELPWFADALISDIQSPSGWDYAVEMIGTPNDSTLWDGIAAWQDPADPLYQGPDSPFTNVTQVLHWYSKCWVNSNDASCNRPSSPELTNAIFPVLFVSEGQTSLAGFGFTAPFGSTGAPYQASWAYLDHWTGDPEFPLLLVPASPDTLGNASVPEPTTLALLGIGLAGLGVARRRKP